MNGVETDEPEWMKDFRLKKEKRAEEEKRRREREDQKKQAIPSWKREILVKRNQKVGRDVWTLDSLLLEYFGLYVKWHKFWKEACLYRRSFDYFPP